VSKACLNVVFCADCCMW